MRIRIMYLIRRRNRNEFQSNCYENCSTSTEKEKKRGRLFLRRSLDNLLVGVHFKPSLSRGNISKSFFTYSARQVYAYGIFLRLLYGATSILCKANYVCCFQIVYYFNGILSTS